MTKESAMGRLDQKQMVYQLSNIYQKIKPQTSADNQLLFSKDQHHLKFRILVPVAFKVISFSSSRLEKQVKRTARNLQTKLKQVKKILCLTGRLLLLNLKHKKEKKLIIRGQNLFHQSHLKQQLSQSRILGQYISPSQRT